MADPVRLQLSRRRGFRLTSPNGLPIVKVDRSTRWGNPFTLDCYSELWSDERRRKAALADFEAELGQGRLRFTSDDVRRELRGKNLACWCPAGALCHADVLLREANR